MNIIYLFGIIILYYFVYSFLLFIIYYKLNCRVLYTLYYNRTKYSNIYHLNFEYDTMLFYHYI